MTPFDPLRPGFWLPVGVALLCGAIVGCERQLRGKPAGIRTSTLICLSTYLFVHLAASLAPGSGDPARVLGQVVTGVGFLGAGVMFSREGTVTGVTTAAVIWQLAGIGALIGFGQYAAGIALALVTVAVLTGVEWVEGSFRHLRRGVHARRPERQRPGGPGEP